MKQATVRDGFKCHLAHLEPPGKRLSLRNYLDQVDQGSCLWGTILTVNRCGETQPTMGSIASWLDPELPTAKKAEVFALSLLLSSYLEFPTNTH